MLQLARWTVLIERHYSARRGQPTPMDIEWVRDGPTGELFIVQARPETVHNQQAQPTLKLYQLLAEAFAEVFDGFSIGSNDLSQLTLGVDHDSTRIASLFDDPNRAVPQPCAQLIERAHRHGRRVGRRP